MLRSESRNTARFWLSPAMPGLSLLQADFTAHDYAPHSHDALVVAVTEMGGAEFTSRGCTEEARENVLLVFNPGEPHSGRMARSRRWRYRSLYLDQAALAGIGRLVGVEAAPYFNANLYRDAGLIDAFLRLHAVLEGEGGGAGLEGQELLAECFGLLLRRHGSRREHAIAGDPRDEKLFRRLVTVMHDRHAERLVLQDLADIAGLTPFQLIRLFRKMSGLTPHAYLTQIRLAVALDLLKARRPIAEAALAAGFFDQSALNRHCRRALGITPRQYMVAQAARNFCQ
ncbi:AraC family transcriptional regulator [Ferrovibrio sp.]|uniref:AraC family transcriptional regulator n=1 Tax=Ferrovibrio sp. TaxID=1917215 RepID=UPI00311FF3D4